jgi:hypothetical protein
MAAQNQPGKNTMKQELRMKTNDLPLPALMDF